MGADPQPAVAVLIPVMEHEDGLPGVLDALPKGQFAHVVLVKVGEPNGLTELALRGRATLLTVPSGGIGAAALRGLEHLESLPERPSIVVMLRADGSDDPADIPALLRPILRSRYDLVIGSRMIGPGHGAGMDTVQRCGNALAVQLIRVLYGYSYTDLSTYFAIRFPAFVALGINDTGPGFATELRVKALKVGLRVAEVPVACRRRADADGSEHRLRKRFDTSYKSLYQILRNATIR